MNTQPIFTARVTNYEEFSDTYSFDAFVNDQKLLSFTFSYEDNSLTNVQDVDSDLVNELIAKHAYRNIMNILSNVLDAAADASADLHESSDESDDE